ncbi:MAG: aminotransferase class IV [Dehalococcoidia bacterium]
MTVAGIVYLNGKLVPRSEAKLSALDHGFLYGYGLFETMRAYNGHIFRLDAHLTRLRCSAESIGLTHSILTTNEGKQSLKAACAATLQANELKDAGIRLTVTAGEGDMTPDPTGCRAPTVLITVQELNALQPEKYETGFKTVISSVRRNSQSPLSRLKSTCYVENIIARMAARAAGCDEAIFLNEQGYLAEGSMTNIFLVSNGELITPCFETGVLPGITKDAVLEIARNSNFKATERWVELNELLEAQEAFVTNSILELMPLVSVDGRPIGSGKPGKLSRELLLAYRKVVNEAVELDISKR